MANLYEGLAVEDIKHAADVLRPVFDATYGGGQVKIDKDQTLQQFSGQLSTVKELPDWLGPLSVTCGSPGERAISDVFERMNDIGAPLTRAGARP